MTQRTFRVLVVARHRQYLPWIQPLVNELRDIPTTVTTYTLDKDHLYSDDGCLILKRRQSRRSALRQALLGLLNYTDLRRREAGPGMYANDWLPESPVILRLERWTPLVLLSPLAKTLHFLVKILPAFADKQILDLVSAEDPDFVIASPSNVAGSWEREFLWAGRVLNIPSGYPVLSLDNLTSKGLLLPPPSIIYCWNQQQSEICASRHSLPNTLVLGSVFFSHWFTTSPPNREHPSEIFRVLFLASSSRIGGRQRKDLRRTASERANTSEASRDERALLSVMRALAASNSANSQAVKRIGVRNHPMSKLKIDTTILPDLGIDLQVVKTEAPGSPEYASTLQSQALAHQLAIGQNTSAMLDFALAGCPCIAWNAEIRVTKDTEHLQCLVEHGIVFPVSDIRELESILRGDHQEFAAYCSDFSSHARNFVGLNSSEPPARLIAQHIVSLLSQKGRQDHVAS